MDEERLGRPRLPGLGGPPLCPQTLVDMLRPRLARVPREPAPAPRRENDPAAQTTPI